MPNRILQPMGLPAKCPLIKEIYEFGKIYPFDFFIPSYENLKVLYYIKPIDDIGIDTPMRYLIDYTITGNYDASNGYDGGTVQLTDEMDKLLQAIGNEITIIIVRDPVYDQPTAYMENSDFQADVQTQSLNHIVMQTQDLCLKLKQAILFPYGYEGEMNAIDFMAYLNKTLEEIRQALAHAGEEADYIKEMVANIQFIVNTVLPLLKEATVNTLGVVRLASDLDIVQGNIQKVVRAVQLRYEIDNLRQRARYDRDGVVRIALPDRVANALSVKTNDPDAYDVVALKDVKRITSNLVGVLYNLGNGGTSSTPEVITSSSYITVPLPRGYGYTIITPEIRINVPDGAGGTILTDWFNPSWCGDANQSWGASAMQMGGNIIIRTGTHGCYYIGALSGAPYTNEKDADGNYLAPTSENGYDINNVECRLVIMSVGSETPKYAYACYSVGDGDQISVTIKPIIEEVGN